MHVKFTNEENVSVRMGKVFNVIIEVVYWLLFFLSPFLISAIISVLIYFNNPNNHWLPFSVLILGVLSGIVLSERIRRKYGTSNYMGRLWGNSEMEDNPQRMPTFSLEEIKNRVDDFSSQRAKYSGELGKKGYSEMEINKFANERFPLSDKEE